MKNLVDWNKAPEGATHYNKECTCPWLKATPPSYFDHWDWVEYGPHAYENHFNNAVKRPQEWDGSGVPPVGTVCEYRLGEGTWFKCEVVYVLSGSADCFVVWCEHLGSDKSLTLLSDRYKLELRKIKTPKQIEAEEKRQQAINEMLGLVENYSTFKDVMGLLYDGGYRKTEVKK